MGCIKTSGVININNNNDNNEEINKKIIEKQKKGDSNKCKEEIIVLNNKLSINQKDKIIIKNASKIDDKYIIFEKFSKNSISSDYKIQSKQNPEIFKAMKIFKKSLIQEDDENSIFEEIKILKSLNHENIIKVEDIYKDKINYYIIFEYSQYGSIENIFKEREKLSENQSRFIIFQILNGLKYLKDKNYIHSNLKPENILITENFIYKNEKYYKIKLIVFGSENSFQNNSNNNIPYYMAPELFNKIYNSKCDIWSLGIILFQLIYGYKPYKGETLIEFTNNLNENIKYENENEKNFNLLSNDGKDFIENLLLKDYEKRFDVDLCLKHKWITKENLFLIQKDETLYKKENESPTLNYKKNDINWSIKPQFRVTNSKNFHTGLYKMDHNNNIQLNKLKTNTQIPFEDFNHIFLHSLIKYMNYYIAINFKKNKEEIIIFKLYNENKNLIKEDLKNLYKCVLEYCGVISFCVRYISFKDKVKNDINLSFTQENNINFSMFENFLFKEKRYYLEIELSHYFEKIDMNKNNEIINCLNLDFPKKEKYQQYFILLTEELNNNQNYSFKDFKNLINTIIDKVNAFNNSLSNTVSNSNVFSINFSNNATFNETIKEKSINNDEKNEKENILKPFKKLPSSNNLSVKDAFSVFNKKNTKYSDSNFLSQNENKEYKGKIENKSSFNSNNKKDTNAFDPEKFLLLIDNNNNNNI
jgi:serine/threonine protein kinase